MKNKICCILFTLIAISIIYLRFSYVLTMDNQMLAYNDEIKFVHSELLEEEIIEEEIIVEEKEKEVKKETKKEKEEVVKQSTVKQDVIVKQNPAPKPEKIVEEKVEEKVEEVIKTENEVIYGKMTGYGPDCRGCSGYLAYGTYVGNGNIYYTDKEYGKVRIVAGDKKYKFGTIVKINDSMLAIVLDRGGAIGIGKQFLFDLLYQSEAAAVNHGVMSNVKFEVLRNGF